MASSRSADLLSTCPHDQRSRYEKMAARAESGSRAAAMKLKCLECCAWSQAEVGRCQIRSCSLWRYRSAAKKEESESEE